MCKEAVYVQRSRIYAKVQGRERIRNSATVNNKRGVACDLLTLTLARPMRTVSVFLVAAALATQASAENLSATSTEALIGRLTAITGGTIGISDRASFSGFLAEGASPRFAVGLLPVHEAVVYPAMHEIVRRGTSSLPALLAHINDSRPTGIRVGKDITTWETVGGQFFSDEYDARDLGAKPSDCTIYGTCRSFKRPYTIKVGDVCEVLIGQIVNRTLFAARYQPTALVYVNSPIEIPLLATRIRKDWSGLDARAHEASLLSDLRSENELYAWHGYRDALIRLRFYYPKTYAALSGKDLEKRNRFEADEKAQKERAVRSQL